MKFILKLICKIFGHKMKRIKIPKTGDIEFDDLVSEILREETLSLRIILKNISNRIRWLIVDILSPINHDGKGIFKGLSQGNSNLRHNPDINIYNYYITCKIFNHMFLKTTDNSFVFQCQRCGIKKHKLSIDTNKIRD